LSTDDRRRHTYAVGQTGTGKTTLFESMILADLRAGEGLCVIDPHGDLIEKLLTKIPDCRAEDVIVFDPGDTERPVGFNMLEYETEAQKYFLVQEIIAIIERLLQQWDPATSALARIDPFALRKSGPHSERFLLSERVAPAEFGARQIAFRIVSGRSLLASKPGSILVSAEALPWAGRSSINILGWDCYW
jgi:hypothetical protein